MCNKARLARCAAGMLLTLVLAAQMGCAVTPTRTGEAENPHFARLDKAQAQIPEARLLDVWIELFDPGRPAPGDGPPRSMEIREAEARFMPLHLRSTMESTGFWGAVRVVPQGVEGGEVRVRGHLLQSDADRLALEISAEDARGRVWFNSVYEVRPVAEETEPASAAAQIHQPLYNAIANDLARYGVSLSAADVSEVRALAERRFAAELLPEVFAADLVRSGEGRYRLQPGAGRGGPMLARIRAVRERDYLLIDTLNGHYDNFYRAMEMPYREWRKALLEESAALRELETEANQRKWLGIAGIVGAIALEAFSGGEFRSHTSSLRSLMLAGGVYALKTGLDKASETGIHRAAIKELDDSFAAEVGPLLVEVEGEVHELTGSAERQFGEWRRLLKRIYAAESGNGAESMQ